MAAVIKITIDGINSADGALRSATQGVRDLDDAARKSGGGFDALRSAGGAALGALAAAATTAAAALGGVLVTSLSAAGDFEAGMNAFQAAAGNMGQSEVEAFKQQFLELGQSLPVSTKAVQDAATALVKGGIDPATVSAGALADTIQFSLANGFETIEAAADLSAKQLATFGEASMTAAEKAAFLANSQDLITKAANTSTLDAAKLGDALLAAGGQARAAGLEYEDFVTTMGAISGSFGSAAEAGTSFKNFLVRLQPSTKAAAEAMGALGLLTEDGNSKFYDAQGQFIGMTAAADLLQEAFTGLSDAQRIQAMQTIFGNDAMGAAGVLAAGGGEAITAFSEAMQNANGVAEQGAATQKGFNFAIENLKGSIEALQISIGSALLPVLTPLISRFTDGVNAAIAFTSALTSSADPVAMLTAQFPPLQGAITMAQSALASLGSFIATVMPTAQAIVTTALAVMAAFWQAHGATVLQVVSAAFTAIQGVIQVIMGVVQGVLAIALATITGDWDTAFTQLSAANTTIWNGIRTFLFGVLNAIAAFFGTSVDGLITLWSSNLAKLATVATTAINDALAAFRTALAPAAEIGAAIISGIIGGITGGASKLAKAATDAANSALKAAKEALGIQSPSKVFSEQVGLPIAQGMALGISANAGLVAGAGAGLAGAAVAGAQSTTTNNYFNYSPTYSATPSRPSADFAAMRALAGAGV